MDTPDIKPTTPAAPQQASTHNTSAIKEVARAVPGNPGQASEGERGAQHQQVAGMAPVPKPEVVPAPAPQDDRAGRGGFRSGRRGGQTGRGRGNRPPRKFEKPEYDSQAIDIARVTRVTKGGKRFSFRTTIVIGNGKGKVGVGIAQGKDVAQSIQKATNQARKNMFQVLIKDGTIPYAVSAKYSSAVVILKPSKGGVKAGGPVRVVARMAGITSLTGKLTERTNNKLNIAMATIKALQQLRREGGEMPRQRPSVEQGSTKAQ